MPYDLFIAVVGIVVLVSVWMAVYALARRWTPGLSEESDVLACGTCGGCGACRCRLDAADSDGTLAGGREFR